MSSGRNSITSARMTLKPLVRPPLEFSPEPCQAHRRCHRQ
jgi:hypothetical protein